MSKDATRTVRYSSTSLPCSLILSVARSHRHIFSQSAGPKVTSWANWWMAKDKVVELKHLRDVDALTDFDVAKDHLTNAAAAVDRSEDQMRQLLAAETALTAARQKLLKWDKFTREQQTTLFPYLVECHHLLICTTYPLRPAGRASFSASVSTCLCLCLCLRLCLCAACTYMSTGTGTGSRAIWAATRRRD